MSKATILVIEDNKDILHTVQILLERDGFTVAGLESCSAAFDYLTRSRPDAILIDLMIPEMTGLEFIHRIRRVGNYDHIPIIAMSAYDRTYLAAALVAGAVTALHKPEDIGILVETVSEVLRKSHRVERAGHDVKPGAMNSRPYSE